MVTVVQGKVCAKNHPDRLSRLATIHQRYRRTDGRISNGIGLDLTVGQKSSDFDEILYTAADWTLAVGPDQLDWLSMAADNRTRANHRFKFRAVG